MTDTENAHGAPGAPPRGEGGEPDGDGLGAFLPGARARFRGSGHGALLGARLAVKDLFDVAGTRTGAGNPEFLADAPIATASAPAVIALLDAGAELVGKTVTDELAFSLSGTNIHYGTPRNSAAPDRVPGGSSSGSASAVAGGAADLALGTDTGGSVRVPASYCGIFGLRPTHGRISARGVVPLAPGLDTVGLFATDGPLLAAAWTALATGAPAGPSPSAGERESSHEQVDNRAISTLVCPPELFALLDGEARADFEQAADECGRQLRCRVVERSIVPPDELVRLREVFRAVQLAEAWQSHGDWITNRRPQLGPGVASRFAAAAAIDPASADQLVAERAQLRKILATALGEDELLLQPAASGVAPLRSLAGVAKDDLRLRTLTLTALAGVAGVPVVALPLAEVGGLPLGVALVALDGEDELLVSCASRVAASR